MLFDVTRPLHYYERDMETSTLYVTTLFCSIWNGLDPSPRFQEWTKLAADAHESMVQLAVFQIRVAALAS